MKRRATITRDLDGTVIATVPLGPKAEHSCIMDLQSWHWLMNEGFSENLNYIVGSNAKKYVTLGDKNNKTLMVGRLLAGAKGNQRVQYINKDPLDLRKENLKVVDNKR